MTVSSTSEMPISIYMSTQHHIKCKDYTWFQTAMIFTIPGVSDKPSMPLCCFSWTEKGKLSKWVDIRPFDTMQHLILRSQGNGTTYLQAARHNRENGKVIPQNLNRQHMQLLLALGSECVYCVPF